MFHYAIFNVRISVFRRYRIDCAFGSCEIRDFYVAIVMLNVKLIVCRYRIDCAFGLRTESRVSYQGVYSSVIYTFIECFSLNIILNARALFELHSDIIYKQQIPADFFKT